MRVAQIPAPNQRFEIVERPLPTPGPGTVRVRVQACGICHSDSLVHEGQWPGITYPRVPGHEVVGVIDAVGPDAGAWRTGQRVGIGWHGGNCGRCLACRRGDLFACETQAVTGITFDGGYGEAMVAPISALAAVPDDLSQVDAAPLMCAGITTFNALRNSGARAGDVVAILGLGGLGHLAVQFAARMGFRTVAIARGAEKGALAQQLGAHHYIDSKSEDPSAALAKLGGASVILATVTAGDAMAAVQGGLAIHGKLMIVGVTPTMEISPIVLINGRRSVQGWYSGTSQDSEETLAFSAQSGVRSMNEVYPLDDVNKAYERMMSGKARFRVVLSMA